MLRRLPLIVAVPLAVVGCVQHKIDPVEVKPIQVEPIHLTIDVNVRVDRELDRLLDYEERIEREVQRELELERAREQLQNPGATSPQSQPQPE